MPPKKALPSEKKALIGRVGTNLKVGIVGLPNVGKSSFFNVLTKSQAQAENFPFCTIDPNESRVPVPDARYDFLVEHYKPASKVPAFLNVTDIAGLVKGASEGQGLGNAFLSHIKACDALFHLCRAFDDDDVTHVEGEVEPVRDLAIINEELRLKDEAYLLPFIEKFEKNVLRSDKKAKPEYDILLKIKSVLCEDKKHLRFQEWNANEIEVLNKHLFLTAKPVIYLVNLSEKDFIRKKNKCKVPAFLNVTDIAGLVKGASEGQGLGNAFLSHIKACDALFHLCRAFDDDDVTHVEGEVEPVRDLAIINEELRLKDEAYLLPFIEKFEKNVLRSDKKAKPEYDILLKIKSVLCEDKKHLRFQEWNANEIEVLNKHLFLTAKPVIYLVNLSEKDFIRKKNKWLVKIKEAVEQSDPGALIVPFSAAFENKVIDMSPEEKKAFEEETKANSQLEKIIVAGYKALQLQYFFTCGPDEVKAWTIQAGTKAPQAAGRIHTDFEKGFIMAEVMKYKDFHELGSEAAVKAAGGYRQQGKTYVVEDGDIIYFKFNAGAGLSGKKK
ncbi:obg-like ATPase 1 [Pollicipes pollicipes]|uniref:obg-like ATPase 1 n=2 Tax=Pollicipes pollicipes TaxID=41117 RepID=UPI00188574AE|nr:obg-like ATPase 1 [Pollicipes pollicipes]